MLSVNSNISALMARTSLLSSERVSATSQQQLATGNRINSSADDAAGIAISVGLQSQIKSTQQAIRNANDGISMLQTMESGVAGIEIILQRMRELSVQVASDTNSLADKQSIYSEISQLKLQVQDIVAKTQWNGISLLNGAANGGKPFQLNVGSSPGGSHQIQVDSPILSRLFERNLPTAGPAPFASVQTSLASITPHDVSVGDFNNDDKPDVVVTNFNNSTDGAYVLLGDGDGQFTQRIALSTGASQLIWSTATGDLNGDAKQDVVLTNGQSVFVYTNNGSSNFSLSNTYNIAAGAADIALEDVNSDGRLDIVTTSLSDNKISTLLNDGAGNFGAPTISIGGTANGGYTTFGMADLDGDNKTDIVMTNRDAGTITVMMGNGDGSFEEKSTYSIAGAPSAVTFADLNNDNKLDVITGNFNSGKISVLLNNGDGILSAPTDYAATSHPYSLASSDFNGDGKIDIAVSDATANSNSITLLYGNGDGTLVNKTDYQVGTIPLALATEDFNRDGKNDLVTGNTSASVSTLLNIAEFPDTQAPPTLGEIDGMLAKLGSIRASIGAESKAVSYAIESLERLSLNLAASKSHITDTDYASATTDLAKSQIIRSAASAMLAQANKEPELVAALIKQFI